MEIRPLADMPDAAGLLAECFYSEWNAFDGRTCAEITAQLRNNLNRDSLPITFVAIEANDVIATVSLDKSDLPSYEHLSPWLASLYVLPVHRRRGIGRSLVAHAIGFAEAKGISPIYLWTPGSLSLYQSCGWQVLRSDVYGGQPITLMQWKWKKGP